jgi:hypothetical protein
MRLCRWLGLGKEVATSAAKDAEQADSQGSLSPLEVAQEKARLLTTLAQSWFDEWRSGRLGVTEEACDADRRQVWELAKETKTLLDARRKEQP